MEHFLITSYPAILAGFFYFIKPSTFSTINLLTKNVLKVSLYHAYLLPLPE
ncbi:hypothetical protein CN905_27750 [Bacillus wiedmannii]|nr:hypothetical protein CN905_27750 [Bacillus wiedmannii]PFZ67238.1 hypothetical protein COL76_02460 [Bacillus wiedmannii]PHE03656.1 hypothetical protein COF56_15620 [Bacillus wiedmannii]PHG69088.1 hypothetical protein COI55_15000 [Bacillus wiedmannii]